MHELLFLIQMYSSNLRVNRGHCTHNTIVTDGIMTMPPKVHFDHVVKRIAQIVNYWTMQLPAQYNVSLDTNRFLSAFSMVEDGERVSCSPWPLGPGISSKYSFILPSSEASSDSSPHLSLAGSSPSSELNLVGLSPERQAAITKWVSYYEKMAMCIPWVVGHEKGRHAYELLLSEVQALEQNVRGGRPRTSSE